MKPPSESYGASEMAENSQVRYSRERLLSAQGGRSRIFRSRPYGKAKPLSRLTRKRSRQDKVIRGNSFVPSYFRPLRNIPYMAWSNFLATAMSACRRALFRARRLSKKAFTWGSQRDATSAGM